MSPLRTSQYAGKVDCHVILDAVLRSYGEDESATGIVSYDVRFPGQYVTAISIIPVIDVNETGCRL